MDTESQDLNASDFLNGWYDPSPPVSHSLSFTVRQGALNVTPRFVLSETSEYSGFTIQSSPFSAHSQEACPFANCSGWLRMCALVPFSFSIPTRLYQCTSNLFVM